MRQRIQTLEKARAEFVSDISSALKDTLQAGLTAAQPGLRSKRDASPAGTSSEESLSLAWRELSLHGESWVSLTRKAWLGLLDRDEIAHSRFASLQLEIEDPSAVEHRILASRLATHFQEACTAEFADLRLRILHIERTPELSSFDVLQPSVFSLSWVEAWSGAGLSASTWDVCAEAMQKEFLAALLQAYKKVNSTLIRERVLPAIDHHKIRKRDNLDTASATSGFRPGHSASSLAQQAAHFRQVAGLESGHHAGHGWNDVLGMAGGGASYPILPGLPMIQMPMGGQALGQSAWVDPRVRARGIASQMANLLSEKIGFVSTAHDQPFGLDGSSRSYSDTTLASLPPIEPPPHMLIPAGAGPKEAVELLRQYSTELKRRAGSNQDKATIEVVALMFQNILGEERIADSIRLLFARLQIPVIRVALAEPKFFESLDHPARRLIDRMGACVLGLDPTSVAREDLEAEIRRMVEFIEQYPESGSKVFATVLDDFEEFLEEHLSSPSNHRKVLDVAQQIEKKETLGIQYTIEIRNLLQDLVLSDVLRDFLLKIWSEVLAMCAVRHGPDDPLMAKYKKVISQIVWAGTPKPERAERMRMIAEMPALLQLVREGMTLINVPVGLIDNHVKALGDSFTEAFQTKTQSLPADRLAQLSEQLSNLESLFSDHQLADLPIDAESLELMLDLDPQALTVVTHLPEPASDAALMWAREMDLGQWFHLRNPNGTVLLQYVWRSDRRQLHLFATSQGKSYLFLASSLASHLQGNLLAPIEHEALTVRATRMALDRIQANPSQLLD